LFQVGADNPNVGNDRRKSLIDALAQQLAQRFAQSQTTGAGSLGLTPFKNANPMIDQERRRPGQVAAGTTPTRAAGAGRDTMGTSILGGAGVPAGIAGRLGPGGAARSAMPFLAGAAVASPGAFSGHLAPQPGTPIPAGNTINPPAPAPPAGAAGPSQGALHPVQSVNLNPGVKGDAGLEYTTGVGTGVVTPDASGNAALVPLGGGRFFDPNSGQMMGIPAGSLGSFIRGLM